MIPRKLRDSERPAGRQPTAGFLVDTVSHAPAPIAPASQRHGYGGIGGLPPKWAQVVGDHDLVTPWMTVDYPPYFSVDDIVKVARTGEVFRVTEVNSRLGVIRAIGSTQACPLRDRDDLLILGSANPGATFKSVTS